MLGVVCCFVVCLFLSANVELNLADSSSQAWGGWGIPHLLNPLMLTGLSEDTLSCARAEDTLSRAPSFQRQCFLRMPSLASSSGGCDQYLEPLGLPQPSWKGLKWWSENHTDRGL